MKREEILSVAKPILFNTEMVRAILAGRKKCTRRIVKYEDYMAYGLACINGKWNETYQKDNIPEELIEWYVHKYKRPLYQAGDILYVRETWCDPTPDKWSYVKKKYKLNVSNSMLSQTRSACKRCNRFCRC